MKKCAPILIPTLCRDIHFIRLIESLKLNTWAKYTDVFIGLDYPPSEKYMEGYRRICEYLEGDFCQFKSFNVIRRHKNYGSRENMVDLRSLVFKTYDRFIRTDDDAEFSPNFLEYMNKCLNRYENDPNIIAVSGYSYPIKWGVSEDATVLKENFVCPMWGTGFWRDKYLKLSGFIEEGCLGNNVDQIINENLYKFMSDRSKLEYVNLCLGSDFEGSLACRVTDISVRMYTALYNKYVIIPVLSKVRNWGFDGTGEYCGKTILRKSSKETTSNYDYSTQEIDKSYSFEMVEDSNCNNKYNLKLMNQFDPVTNINKIRIALKISLYRIFGRERMSMLITKFRKTIRH